MESNTYQALRRDFTKKRPLIVYELMYSKLEDYF